MKITVLDHGHVEYVTHMGDDLTVVNAARVSFNKESELDPESVLKEKDKKLIGYLAKHGHWTPFAHPQITLRIKAPISIRTQFFKHKVGFVENEISRRYVSDTPTAYNPRWRGKPTTGAKQGSDDFMPAGAELDQCESAYRIAVERCMETYNTLLANGVAPEQARFVLPQGVYTEWWWTGSLASYARFYKQRRDPHAQWEIREYAGAIGEIISGLFPVSWATLIS